MPGLYVFLQQHTHKILFFIDSGDKQRVERVESTSLALLYKQLPISFAILEAITLTVELGTKQYYVTEKDINISPLNLTTLRVYSHTSGQLGSCTLAQQCFEKNANVLTMTIPIY